MEADPVREGGWGTELVTCRMWEAVQVLVAAIEAVLACCRLGTDQQTWHRGFGIGPRGLRSPVEGGGGGRGREGGGGGREGGREGGGSKRGVRNKYM